MSGLPERHLEGRKGSISGALTQGFFALTKLYWENVTCTGCSSRNDHGVFLLWHIGRSFLNDPLKNIKSIPQRDSVPIHCGAD